MSTNKDKINANSISPQDASSNKSNITDAENIIVSQQILNNMKLKKEFSFSEINDSNNNINNKNKSQKIAIKSESYNKNRSNLQLNPSYSNFKKNNISNHIVITSKTRKKPDLIKNIHYKTDIKKSYDNFRYQPTTSFEQKLSKQLSRLSNKYTVIKNRKFFNNQLTNTNIYWLNFPDYEIYRQLKELETRKEFPYAFVKPRLKPLINPKKDKLGILAKNLYEADQVDKFKKFLNKNYKIKIGE